MMYQKKRGKYVRLSEKPLTLEASLEKLVGKNLEAFFGLRLVKSQFRLGSRRIDTLAFDPKSKCFAIIEYKRKARPGMIEQAFGYGDLLSTYRHECLNAYNSKTPRRVSDKQVRWDDTRIMLVSPSFTDDQKSMANRPQFDALELWKIKTYRNVVELDQINSVAGIKDYSLKRHVSKDSPFGKMNELFQRYHDRIKKFGKVSVYKAPNNVSFKRNPPLNFAKFYMRKDKIEVRILIDAKTADPKKLIHTREKMKIDKSKGWIKITDGSKFNDVLKLIKNSYKISMDVNWSTVATIAGNTKKVKNRSKYKR